MVVYSNTNGKHGLIGLPGRQNFLSRSLFVFRLGSNGTIRELIDVIYILDIRYILVLLYNLTKYCTN